jgi:glycosyltransferase involved in cell wall biosynthesis
VTDEATLTPVTHAGQLEPSELRVLQYVTVLGYGGAEKLTADLARGLKPRVAAIEVASDVRFHNAYVPALEASGVPLVDVPVPFTNPRSVARSARALGAAIRSFRPDVLHAHNPAAGVVAAIARRAARRPDLAILTTYHGVRPHRLRLASKVMKVGDLVIAVGPGTEQQLRSMMPASRIIRIDNAVDPEVQRSPHDVREEFDVGSRQLLISVGRFTEQKDHRLLLNSLATLKARGRPVLTLLVGWGPLESELRELTLQLSLEDSVNFVGTRTDAVDLIAAADIVVHTAAWEGLPLALLEAMSLGRPIVAADAVGVSDLIVDNVTGLLVRPRTSLGIADAIERLLDDPTLCTKLGMGAKRSAATQYSFDRFIDAHIAAYQRAIAARRGRVDATTLRG